MKNKQAQIVQRFMTFKCKLKKLVFAFLLNFVMKCSEGETK